MPLEMDLQKKMCEAMMMSDEDDEDDLSDL